MLSLLAVLLAFCPLLVRGQVTIGDGTPPQNYSILEVVSNGNGGLRLPHLTNEQRNALRDGEGSGAVDFKKDPTRATPFLYEGLTIYNTTTRCIEYYNAHRWISMCDGTSQMVISPAPCDNIAADGTGCDNEFTVTDPDCVNGPFSLTVITGSDFASLYDTDEAAGTFKISFSANNSTNQRSAIVRVTSSCTALYKDFLFTQVGQACDPALGQAPSIISVPEGKNIAFCAGGAVYLSVPANTPNLDELIWTRNGAEIARGVYSIAATQAGVYDVWMGIIGCNQLAGNAVTVTKSGTGAPSPVDIVVRGNNGLVCDANGTTKLIANTTSSGTVRWFKDGVLQNQTSPSNEIDAGIGQWFAVVNDGTCWSTPSETVTVSVDPNAGSSLTEPVVTYNGQSNITFCAGSSVQMAVTNSQAGYTYTWYENNTQLGTGINYLYTVPTGVASVVIRCRATMAGSCSGEAIAVKTISTGTIPGRPSITGDSQLCSGTATLNVIPASAGTYTYSWYKDNQLIATSQSITITEGGDYYASVTETGGCSSPLAHRNISTTSSAAPGVTLNKSSESPNQNDVVTYMAAITFGPATSYTWTITNATLESGGGNTAGAVVKFDKTGAAEVKVEVSNACGIGTGIHTVTNVQSACIDPSSVSPSANSAHSTTAGQGMTLGKVSATFDSGSPETAYQWYSNTTNSDTGGTAISGATGDSYVATNTIPGTYYYYCRVSNKSCASEARSTGVYTVTVSMNPEDLQVGTGTFTGKTCFDVVETNDGGSCGTLTGRASQKADFSQMATHTQTYTFTTSGTVSKLRFIYVNAGEEVIESIDYNKSLETQNNLSGTYTVTVNYKQDLNAKAAGKSREEALKATLYAVYNNASDGNGTDAKLQLLISVQDCTCCPGYLAVGGGYAPNYSGFLTLPAGSNYQQARAYYTATGKDVCFYKKDANAGLEAYWTYAKNMCARGDGVDVEDSTTGTWRLPYAIELAHLPTIYLTDEADENSYPGIEDLKKASYLSLDQTNTNRGSAWRFVYNNYTPSYYEDDIDLFRCVLDL